MASSEYLLLKSSDKKLIKLQKSGAPPSTCYVVRDARKFVTAFGANTVSRSTPHIYVSALPFWSPEDPVWKNYRRRTQGLITLEGSAMLRRDLATIAVWTAPAAIHSIAVSSDGTRVVSGSYDNTIHIWDTQSGKLAIEPLKGHDRLVTSVAFSPNGARVVSGNEDHAIRIWDAEAGKNSFRVFKGHTDWVNSVVWSPDSALIASGSSDWTICIWDMQSGSMAARYLEGHADAVLSVAFSPNCRFLASGSSDHTVRIWDVQSGKAVAMSSKGRLG
jgi:WD40 repeat protein